MRIDRILAANTEPVFSFEFFPPKTPEGERNLYEAIARLKQQETQLQAAQQTFMKITSLSLFNYLS